MLTVIQVTLDGRIVLRRGPNLIELAMPDETRELLASLTEALAQQCAVLEEPDARVNLKSSHSA